MAHEINEKLLGAHGVAIRQRTQIPEAVLQSVGLPYQAQNKYAISLLPSDKAVATDPNDPTPWHPSGSELNQLDTFLFAKEESSLCVRILLTIGGCLNLRPLQMHFQVDGTGEVYLIKRNFTLGACIGCPLVMNLYTMDGQNQIRIGRVKENFTSYCEKCFECCCKCTFYHDVEKWNGTTGSSNMNEDGEAGDFEKLYQVRANLCFCGRVNNCCGATCCKNDAVFDILNNHGEVVAHLQKTYAADAGANACCRMTFEFSNYLMSFPNDSTAHDRMLLITAMFQLEYAFFEREGGDE